MALVSILVSRNGIFSGNFSLVMATCVEREGEVIYYGMWWWGGSRGHGLEWVVSGRGRWGLTSKQSPKSMWRILPLSLSNMRLEGCLQTKDMR